MKSYAERHFSRETMRAALLAALAGEPPPDADAWVRGHRAHAGRVGAGKVLK